MTLITRTALLLFSILIGALLYTGISAFASNNLQHHMAEISIEYDNQMDNITVTEFSENGSIKNTMHAKSMSQLTNSDNMLIEQPVIIMHKDNSPPWNITAKKAKAINNFNEVNLMGSVKIIQAKGENNSATTVLTEAMSFFPDQNIAKTKLEVHIIYPNMTFKSKGFIANFETKHYNLIHNARCQYDS